MHTSCLFDIADLHIMEINDLLNTSTFPLSLKVTTFIRCLMFKGSLLSYTEGFVNVNKGNDFISVLSKCDNADISSCSARPCLLVFYFDNIA